MKNLSIIAFLLLGIQLSGQKLVEWKGGHPGNETSWECPFNWSTSKLPDEFSDVIITNQSSTGNFYPIVSSIVKINSLQMLNGTFLNIAPKAVIHIMNTRQYGFLNLGTVNRANGLYFDEERNMARTQ